MTRVLANQKPREEAKSDEARVLAKKRAREEAEALVACALDEKVAREEVEAAAVVSLLRRRYSLVADVAKVAEVVSAEPPKLLGASEATKPIAAVQAEKSPMSPAIPATKGLSNGRLKVVARFGGKAKYYGDTILEDNIQRRRPLRRNLSFFMFAVAGASVNEGLRVEACFGE